MGDLKERDELVLSHRTLAHLVALAVRRRMPRWVDLEDLDQWALLGLLRAAERYRPTLGVPFPGYAWILVYGYVWDQYRRRHWQDEVAPHIGVNDGPGEPCTFEEDLDGARMAEKVRRALRTLPRRDQKVARLHYGDDLYLREVGERLGVNESRACQLNKRMLGRMREALQSLGVQQAP